MSNVTGIPVTCTVCGEPLSMMWKGNSIAVHPCQNCIEDVTRVKRAIARLFNKDGGLRE